jgi:hypothetical protein
MSWMGHIASMGEIRNAYIFVGNPLDKGSLG